MSDRSSPIRTLVRRGATALWKLAPALIVAGALTALLKADPSRRVDYLKTLAWPVVVVLGYLALREVINDRLRYVVRLSFGGAEAEFEHRQNAELQADLREVAAEFREAAGVLPDPDSPVDPDVPPAPPLGQPSQESVRAKMELFEAVESAIKAGAKWGYNMYSQYVEPPEPVIEWSETGDPNITGAVGRRRTELPPSQRGYTGAWALRYSVPRENVVADAENEVRRLEREYLEASQGVGGIILATPIGGQLAAAKKRLARVDPSNHLLL